LRGTGPVRLLGLAGAASLIAVGAAHALSPEAQQALARAAAFSPGKSADPSPIGGASAGLPLNAEVSAYPFVDSWSSRSASPSWLSQSRTVGLRPGDGWTLSTVSQRVAAGAVLGEPQADTLQPVSYDLSYTRAWPSAFSLAMGKYGLDVSPHATLGAGGSGRTAGAGVTARFGKHLANDLAQRLGVRDTAAFGDQGRFYLFAASSGTAVGFNLLRRDGDWTRAGFSQDATSELIGDTQAGVGWRKGSMQASMGYVHREVKIRQGATDGLMGAADRNDNLVALSFSIKQK
jgi:hypothetical protein